MADMDAAKVRREALEEAARWVRLGRWHDPDACAEGILALIQAAPQPGAQEAQGALRSAVRDWLSREEADGLWQSLNAGDYGGLDGVVARLLDEVEQHRTDHSGAAAPAPSAQPPAPPAATAGFLECIPCGVRLNLPDPDGGRYFKEAHAACGAAAPTLTPAHERAAAFMKSKLFEEAPPEPDGIDPDHDAAAPTPAGTGVKE